MTFSSMYDALTFPDGYVMVAAMLLILIIRGRDEFKRICCKNEVAVNNEFAVRKESLLYLELKGPLGLHFDKKTGDMYIVDAYFGLLKVGPQGGLATPLAPEAEGVPLKFTNDLDLDQDGNIYFTNSSTNYQRRKIARSLTNLKVQNSNDDKIDVDMTATSENKA
ncbi:strictosidine synthase-like 3 [Tanacetum coccineum]